MNILKYSPILAALVLSACASDAPITQPPIEIGLKNAGVQERVVGYTEPIVRTFVPKEQSADEKLISASNPNASAPGIKRTEIIGATCSLDSAEVKGTFTTPAIIRVPKFQGRPTTMRVKCETPTQSADFNARPTLDGVIVGGASVAGLVAAAVTAGVAASRDQWSYGANEVGIWIELKDK